MMQVPAIDEEFRPNVRRGPFCVRRQRRWPADKTIVAAHFCHEPTITHAAAAGLPQQ